MLKALLSSPRKSLPFSSDDTIIALLRTAELPPRPAFCWLWPKRLRETQRKERCKGAPWRERLNSSWNIEPDTSVGDPSAPDRATRAPRSGT